jgi:6-phosphogluconolactonase/Glucosamine-6-phosphate isomerase/deaminase
MLPQQKIEVVAGSSSFADRAVEEFIRLAEETTRVGGMFSVALAGGSTPQQMYTRLSAVHLRWDRIHVFWGDERCLPPEDKDSNFHVANEALLKVIPIPKKIFIGSMESFPLSRRPKTMKMICIFFLWQEQTAYKPGFTGAGERWTHSLTFFLSTRSWSNDALGGSSYS